MYIYIVILRVCLLASHNNAQHQFCLRAACNRYVTATYDTKNEQCKLLTLLTLSFLPFLVGVITGAVKFSGVAIVNRSLERTVPNIAKYLPKNNSNSNNKDLRMANHRNCDTRLRCCVIGNQISN